MRVLAERDDDHLPGIPVRDWDTATTTGQDGDDGGDADVRHERRRDAGSGDSADQRDAGELQPDPGDDPGGGESAGNGIPGGVLWRRVDDTGDDDVLGRRQQRVWTVTANDDVHVEFRDESTGGDLGDAVKRAVRDPGRCADHGSVLHVHASGAWYGPDHWDGDVSVCVRTNEPGEQGKCAGLHGSEREPNRCALRLRECECW